MIQLRTRLLGKAILILLFAFVACMNATTSHAQTWGANGLFSLNTLESVIGPIFPVGGLGNSFRSEIGVGLGVAKFDKATLSSSLGTFDLIRYDPNAYQGQDTLDGSPLRNQVKAIVRLWRLGLRAAYQNFDARTYLAKAGKFDLSGLILGADFDLVQFNWLSIGLGGDFYFIDPYFHGAILYPYVPPNIELIDIKGERPINWGAYFRYLPPDILGFPMHVEAYFRLPYRKASSYSTLGAALVFRPQIYRFDVSAKLTFEKSYLKFSGFSSVDTAHPETLQDWEFNSVWKLFSIEAAIYF
jgi:hypothetical protein